MIPSIDLSHLTADQTVTEICHEILKRAGRPLHYREIMELLLQVKPLKTKTPENSVYARMLLDTQERFVQLGNGMFSLREAGDAPSMLSAPDKPIASERQVRMPLFPLYSEVRLLLTILNGRPRADLLGLLGTLAELRGTPQEPQDWTAPDVWIVERLSGSEQKLALDIWKGSKQQVNPRYVMGHWYLARGYDLLSTDQDGLLHLTEIGRDFVQMPQGESVQLIDVKEGLIKLLSIVAERGPGMRGDFLPEWTRYLQAVSNFNSDSTFKDTLRRRLVNLAERNLIDRSGNSYQISSAGLEYLQRIGGETHGATPAAEDISVPDEVHQLYELANQQRQAVRLRLKDHLQEMDPYQFEDLVRRLLEEMGYEKVQTTAPANDKGVDVIGDIEVGITAVREVIQVKRHRNNIQRPVLDALRGSLHRFGAVRGTIINTGGFSKGTQDAAFEHGAAPITLIDGEKLVDLLIEHQLGVRKKSLEILELDESALRSEVENAAGQHPAYAAEVGELLQPGLSQLRPGPAAAAGGIPCGGDRARAAAPEVSEAQQGVRRAGEGVSGQV